MYIFINIILVWKILLIVDEVCDETYSNALVLLLSDRNSDWLTKVPSA